MWRDENNKGDNDIPSVEELKQYLMKYSESTNSDITGQPKGWGTNIKGVNLQKALDGRFNDTDARLKEGTVIEGIDVGGKTIKEAFEMLNGAPINSLPSGQSKLYRYDLNTQKDKLQYAFEHGYLALWKEWVKQNPKEFDELRQQTKNEFLVTTNNIVHNPAKALYLLLRDTNPETIEKKKKLEQLRQRVDVDRIDISNVISEIDLNYSPTEKRERAKWIAAGFSRTINEYLEENPNLTREQAIVALTPKGIFKRIYNDLQEINNEPYLDLLEEEKQMWLQQDYDEEKAEELAEYYLNNRMEAIGKMLKFFNELCKEARPFIQNFEGICLGRDNITTFAANNNEADEFGESDTDKWVDPLSFEEQTKDGWMDEWGTTPLQDTISQKVRRMLWNITKTDSYGNAVINDIGQEVYLDGDYTYTVINNALRDMLEPNDMIPLLEKASFNKPWLREVIDRIQQDNNMFSQFYTAFRNEFNEYWIQIIKYNKDEGGVEKVKLKRLNRPESIWYMQELWEDTYLSRTKLDNDTIYDNTGQIIQKNGEKALALVKEIATEAFAAQMEMRDSEFKKTSRFYDFIKPTSQYVKNIDKVLRMLGISIEPEDLILYLKGLDKEDPSINATQLLTELESFLNQMKKDGWRLSVDSETRALNLMGKYKSYYYKIAKLFNIVVEDGVEASTREDDKSYYSYTKPNKLRTLIKNLNNVYQNDERWQQFLENEYGQYDWFYDKKNKRWRSGILEEIVENNVKLEIKRVLNQNKNKPNDLEDAEMFCGMWYEFFNHIKHDNEYSYSWYKIPNYSDLEATEYLSMRCYEQDELINKFCDLVIQEYNRIIQVLKRNELYQKGEKIELISNFDIAASKDDIGGAQFKFLPFFNSYTINNRKFIDVLAEKIKNEDTNTQDFIKYHVQQMMSSIFDEEIEKYAKFGVFKRNKNGVGIYTDIDYKTMTKVIDDFQSVFELFRPYLSDSEIQIIRKNIYFAQNFELINQINMNPIFDKMQVLLNYALENSQITREEYETFSKNIRVFKNNTDSEDFEEFIFNYQYAISQIYQLFTTDLAFYGNTEDLQKRWKEVYAMTNKINTEALDEDGNKVGKDFQVVITISDEESISEQANVLKSVLERHGTDSSWVDEKINQTDGQSFRTLDSRKQIEQMKGEWSPRMEKSFNNIKEGIYDAEDSSAILQPEKPFLYTMFGVDDGLGGRIKTSVQVKNSEFTLLSPYNVGGSSMSKSEKLEALNEFMTENKIDVANFASTTKVGMQGVIDISNKNIKAKQAKLAAEGKPHSIKDAVKAILMERTGYGSVNGVNKDVVREYPIADWGIQTQTPVHGIDSEQLVPTQMRKLVDTDMSSDFKIDFDSILNPILSLPDDTVIPDLTTKHKKDGSVIKKTVKDIRENGLTKDDWQRLYNRVITENLLFQFSRLEGDFSTTQKISNLLLDAMNKSTRYSEDAKRAVSLDENGNFNIPLFDQCQANLIQNLINSIIKSRIVKQKIKGGAYIQVTNWGYDNDLNLIFKDANGNELSYKWYQENIKKDGSLTEWRNYVAKNGESVAYYEAYIRCPSTEMYNIIVDENGNVDMDKIPDELKYMVGTRVPCEDKYSMFPMKIKGFLPPQNGSAIMLPKEITTIAGLDFDVDKLYISLLESYEYLNIDKARIDYLKYLDDLRNSNILFKNWTVDDFEEFNFEEYGFDNWLENNKRKYTELRKVEYDFTKSAKENTYEARNNLIVDLMFSALANKNTLDKMLKPGNFKPQEDARMKMVLLRNALSLGYKSAKDLMSLDKETKKKLYNQIIGKINPLTPSTQLHFHKENASSKKMVGIYANNNTMHSMLQKTEAEVNPKYVVDLFGREVSNLHMITDKYGNYISRNVASWIVAANHSVSDPLLEILNQNINTGNVTCYLSSLGYDPLEISVFLNQQIIKEIFNSYNVYEPSIITFTDKIINKFCKKYVDLIGRRNYSADHSTNATSFDIMAQNIVDEPIMVNFIDADSTTAVYPELIDYLYSQIVIGEAFRKVYKASETLKKLTNNFKPDTQNGSVPATFAGTLAKLTKVDKLIQKIHQTDENDERKFPILGIDNLIDNTPIKDMSEDELRQMFEKTAIPYEQAFFSLGLNSTDRLVGKYFPHFKSHITKIINDVFSMGLTDNFDEKTINDILNNYFVYILSGTEFFGDDKTSSAYEKRDALINHFAQYFVTELKDNSDIAELPFMKKLKVIATDKYRPVKTIGFRNVGRLTNGRKETYTNNWAEMLYMSNPEAQKLAFNLLRYGFYRRGFGFGPEGYMHLAPFMLRKMTPDYVTKLNTVMDEQANAEADEMFPMQYIRNHFYNSKFVKPINKDIISLFVKDNQPLDIVTINIDSIDKPYYILNSENDNLPYYFLSTTIGKNTIYYEFNSLDDSHISYKRVMPLGFKNHFIEYEYGVESNNVKSVLYQNDLEKQKEAAQKREEKIQAENAEHFSNPDNSNYEVQDDQMSDEDTSAYLNSLEQEYGIEEQNQSKGIVINTQEEVNNLNTALEQNDAVGGIEEQTVERKPINPKNITFEEVRKMTFTFIDAEGNKICM